MWLINPLAWSINSQWCDFFLTPTTQAVLLFSLSLNVMDSFTYRSLKEALTKNYWSSGRDIYTNKVWIKYFFGTHLQENGFKACKLMIIFFAQISEASRNAANMLLPIDFFLTLHTSYIYNWRPVCFIQNISY
jgi:hypothetical protein